jgi:hypothetical protein
LDVRLHRPSVADLILVSGGNQALEASHRPIGGDKLAVVSVERLGAFGDVCITDCDAELIVGTLVTQANELYSQRTGRSGCDQKALPTSA